MTFVQGKSSIKGVIGVSETLDDDLSLKLKLTESPYFGSIEKRDLILSSFRLVVGILLNNKIIDCQILYKDLIIKKLFKLNDVIKTFLKEKHLMIKKKTKSTLISVQSNVDLVLVSYNFDDPWMTSYYRGT